MVEIGTRVRVLYPLYAAGTCGRIQAREESGRWIVKLDESTFAGATESVLLSLEESDFEIIQEESD
ncbi:MAG: hypothetical protein SAL07_01235 [Oscillatoria sp. PMC 1051.18]|uniref:hypothetical protein n=1 Tax=Oscillatoria salina TaxID=331517 RepID=UPI0013BC7D47|nr:hypothetical protein [Oscillatoria salina]MBZ8179608.1 hypothetical protein [Oscillatoria salina IIICB1]MEC4892457.1 hypothetical protein [Oscillatoria sp. PMC 1050.18]MEC5028507.1 hypothetical protein [Oscillatoria sp. PMC 1051.18]NET90128.1 hypothetical protein [Kamptonema sp. SIO1D9]